jgi:thiamine pyrophosphate-dependent acetolactate synthase large subunit-like protein
MGGPWGADKLPVPGLQLDGSQIDFVRLAAALGVPAECAASPAELRSALERGLAATGPYLVEVDLRQQ